MLSKKHAVNKSKLSFQKASLVWGGDKGVGGGGAGGGTQGLAHWMSVMAEHMNHENSTLPSSYMWNEVI